jgi:hypothetical protein
MKSYIQNKIEIKALDPKNLWLKDGSFSDTYAVWFPEITDV